MRPVPALVFGAFLLSNCCATGFSQTIKIRTPHPARPQAGGVLASLTVSATPSTVTFALSPGGVASGSAPVSISTVGAGLEGVFTSVTLYAYFSTASALTTTAGDVLPSSVIYGMDPNGSPTSFTAFTQTTPFGSNSGLKVYATSNLLSILNGRTDNLSLQINLTNQATQAAGTYSGTLILQAQAL